MEVSLATVYNECDVFESEFIQSAFYLQRALVEYAHVAFVEIELHQEMHHNVHDNGKNWRCREHVQVNWAENMQSWVVEVGEEPLES